MSVAGQAIGENGNAVETKISSGATTQTKPPKPHYHGHRQRLRSRFMEGGQDALPDYELLELVLFAAFRQGDTKPIAKELLAKFKSFAGVINAPPERLLEVKGIGDAAISHLKIIQAAALRVTKTEITDKPLLTSWSQVLDYIRAAQAYENAEVFRILFLDKKNRLIADEVQGRGTVDHTPVYIREVVKRALDLSATAMILVHNHPSGDPTPSQTDIDMTKMIMSAGKPLGVVIHDHVIVGREGHFSMRSQGLL
ncbi:MAG: DNA repair protein RadC [Pseudomonadota bacterium]